MRPLPLLLCGFCLIAMALPVGAQDEPPAVVALVLDSSGSLGADDLEHARVLARDTLAALPADSRVAVFAFDDESRLLQPATADVGLVEAAVAGVRRAGRFTALHDALYDASRYLVDQPGARRAIVLVTDGKDENSAVLLEDGLSLAREQAIPVFAVGVGRVRDSVLRRIAKLTDGSYAPAAAVDGAGLAAAIAALPPRPTRPPPTTVPTPAAAGRVTPPARPEAPRRVALLWLLLVAGLVAAGGAWVVWRRRAARTCPRCGRPLPRPGAACRACARPESGGPTSLGDDAGATMLTRSPVVGDGVERTVVLSARPRLRVSAGPGAGREFDLSPTIATSIGRASANDIVLADDAVSGQHCRVRPEGGRFVLYDLESTNGTFVNDRRVERHPLADGDIVQVGETSFEYRQFSAGR